MIEQYYETKEHVVKEPVLISRKFFCDMCKKEIDSEDIIYHITTGHHGWGNDSIDSIEHFCACGEGCLKKAMEGYILNAEHSPHYEYYIEIEYSRCDLTHHESEETYLDGKKIYANIEYVIKNE